MTVARFKDLCIDAADPAAIGPFWAQVLGLSWQMQDGGDGFLTGRTPQHTIWVNKVPEPKTVKHRVHLDIYAGRLADLQDLGSRIVRPEGDGRGWTVMADPEGSEYCAFLHNELPGDLLHSLVVDSVDAEAQARWWAEVYGGRLVNHSSGYSTVQDVPGMPILTMDFVPVPEPKTVKNRVHWDVTVTDPQQLIDAGATVLRKPDADVGWHVMADPEGNEFCAFSDGA